jgi:hypothetical protein
LRRTAKLQLAYFTQNGWPICSGFHTLLRGMRQSSRPASCRARTASDPGAPPIRRKRHCIKALSGGQSGCRRSTPQANAWGMKVGSPLQSGPSGQRPEGEVAQLHRAADRRGLHDEVREGALRLVSGDDPLVGHVNARQLELNRSEHETGTLAAIGTAHCAPLPGLPFPSVDRARLARSFNPTNLAR